MKKSTLIFIVFLMSISSIGILTAQAYWLFLEAKQAAKEFDNKVLKSLEEVKEQMINDETLFFVQNKIGKAYSFSTFSFSNDEKEEQLVIELDQSNQNGAIILESDSVTKVIHKEVNADIELSELSLRREMIQLEKDISKDSLKFNVLLKKKKNQLQTVLDKLAFEYAINDLSLEERISNANIDSLLEESLVSKGISDAYDYEIRNKDDDILASSKAYDSEIKSKIYKTEIIESFSKRNSAFISIYFPSKLNSIMRSIWINLLISIILSSIILGTFAYTLYSILKQKKLAQMKTDFINNMTHEFKTPIATISLAIDNMMHPLIRKDEKEIEKFGAIIKKENERMDQQIGRVLEIARLEKQDIDLKKEEINIDQLVREAVALFKVNTEENQGDINLQSETNQETIFADKMHLFNAIRNIIENGIKYSKGQFRISIHSFIEDHHWVIKISDKGVGMNQSTLKNIFNRFYRKTDGNLHATKGFGLGLFYTHNIISQHQGDISVKSAVGKGSEFQIKLPLS